MNLSYCSFSAIDLTGGTITDLSCPSAPDPTINLTIDNFQYTQTGGTYFPSSNLFLSGASVSGSTSSGSSYIPPPPPTPMLTESGIVSRFTLTQDGVTYIDSNFFYTFIVWFWAIPIVGLIIWYIALKGFKFGIGNKNKN